MDETIWLHANKGRTRLGFSLLRKEFPESVDKLDSQWIVGNIYYRSRRFNVEMEDIAGFNIQELKFFLKNLEKLDKTVQGSVKYNPTEPYITFDIIINPSGTGVVKGKLRDLEKHNTEMDFEFETDQTQVRKFYISLRTELKTYI